MGVTIPNLSATSTITAGDLLVAYIQANGDNRKLPASVLLAYMQANLTFPSNLLALTTQYSAPSATGFSVSVTDSSGASVHLILTPQAGYAAGTLVLPLLANLVDKQEILVNCTQQITVLTVSGNGATVMGAPSALGADDFFRLKYDSTLQIWYRVG